jgi:hypothetical protein
MSFEARCPQCRFVTQQLGQPTPCLLHVSLMSEADAQQPTVSATEGTEHSEGYDEPYAFGVLRLSVDRPGPFTLHQYVRLQLLRTRLQAEPSRLDVARPRVRARSLSSR